MSAPEPRSPLVEILKPGRYGAESKMPVILHERHLSIVQVQARKGQAAALTTILSSAFGLMLPGAGQTSTTGEWRAVWIQPDTWLVIAPFTGPGDLLERLAAVASQSAAITDQTFGKSVLRLSGAKARDVLAKGCRVDLHPRVFGPGRSSVTPLAQVRCVLIQIDDKPTFDLIVASTFAVSALEWLERSALEFGLEVIASN